jgi:hypothetical protein
MYTTEMPVGPFARRHAGFVALLAVVAPLLIVFSWHAGLAAIGDDSVSYLNMARYFRHPADPLLAEWVGYQTHFPPLFPLVLAVTGGADDLLVANQVVAAFAVLGLCAVYAYAVLCLGSRAGALAITAMFVVLPTAWISVRGILTEPLYLLISVGLLLFHEARMAHRKSSVSEGVILGALLGCAWLTRSAGTALVAAYVVYAAIVALRARGREAPRLLVPVVVFAAMAAAWWGLRPPPQGDQYVNVFRNLQAWMASNPAGFIAKSMGHLEGGWIASFLGDSRVGSVPTVLFAALGLLGVAGAARRAWANHLDGWYVLAFLGMLFIWTFPDDSMRRLLYPVVPLMLLHAVLLVRPLVTRLAHGAGKKFAWPLLAALPLVLILPASLQLAGRAADREPLLPGTPYSLAQMSDYYNHIPTTEARTYAAVTAAMLTGFDFIRTSTPPEARIMWMRPDYVAVLGHRRGVPWYYKGGFDRLLHDAYETRPDYIIASNTYKADMLGEQDDRFESAEAFAAFTRPVVTVPNAIHGGNDFVLLKVDREALERLLRERSAAKGSIGTPGK